MLGHHLQATAGVLVVDDSKFMRTVLTSLLRSNNIPIYAAVGTAREARHYFLEAPPSLVLLDLILQDGNGLDLLNEFHLTRPEVPIIVISSVKNKQIIAQALYRGARDFLIKPIAKQAAIRTIFHHLVNFQNVHQSNLCTLIDLYNLLTDSILKYSPDTYHPIIENIIISSNSKVVAKNAGRLKIDALNRIRPRFPKNVLERTLEQYKKIIYEAYRDMISSLKTRLPHNLVVSLFKHGIQIFYLIYHDLIDEINFFPPAVDPIPSFEEIVAPLRQVLRDRKSFSSLSPSLLFADEDDITEFSAELKVFAVFSYFDEVEGPIILSQYPYILEKAEQSFVDRVPHYLDLEGITPDSPFIIATSEFATVNLYFTLPNKDARGSEEEFLLTFGIAPANLKNVYMWVPTFMDLLLSYKKEMMANIDLIPLARHRARLGTKPITDFLIEVHDEIRQYALSNLHEIL